MKPWMKWSLAALAMVLAVPLLAAAVVAIYLEQVDYKAELAAAVQSRTGRALLIEGDLRARIGWQPQISAEEIRYPNAEWAAHPWALEVQRAVLTLDLTALLRGKLRVRDVRLERPRLRVEWNADGEHNFAPRPAAAAAAASAKAAGGGFFVRAAAADEADSPQPPQPKSSAADATLPGDAAAESETDKSPSTKPQSEAGYVWALQLDGARIIDGEIEVTTRRRQWRVRLDDARVEPARSGARPGAAGSASQLPLMLEVQGAVQDVEITASAGIGSLQTLLLQRESPLQATATLGAPDNKVRIAGSVQNLLRWRGADLQVQYDIAQTEALSGFAGVQLPALRELSGGARLHQPGAARSMAVREIAMRFTHLGLQCEMEGEMESVYAGDGLDLRLRAAGQFARKLPFWLAGDQDASPLTAQAEARLLGAMREFVLQVGDAKLQNENVALRARGDAAYSDREWQGGLPLSFELRKVTHNVGGAWRALTAVLPVRGDALLMRAANDDASPAYLWSLQDMHLNASNEEVKLEAAGAVRDLNAAPKARFKVTGTAAGAKYLTPLLPPQLAKELPVLSDISLTSEVVIADKAARATVENLSLRALDIDFSARGEVARLHLMRGVDLAVEARAANLQVLPKIAGREWPASGEVAARAKLQDGGGGWHLREVAASASGRDFDGVLHGEIRDLGNAMQTDLQVQLSRIEAAALRRLLTAPGGDTDTSWLDSPFMRAMLPLSVSANVYAATPGKWQLRQLDARSLSGGSDARLQGGVESFAPFVSRLHLLLRKVAVAALPADWQIPRPRGGVLDGAADIIIADGRAAVDNLKAVLRAPHAVVQLSGAAGQLRPLAGATLQMKFEADSVEALQLPGTAWLRQSNSVVGDATLRADSTQTVFQLHNLSIGDEALRGDVHVRWPDADNPLPEVTADLQSAKFDLFDLREIFPEREKKPKRARLFTDEKIGADWLHILNARISLTAPFAGNRYLQMRDMKMRFVLQDGKLQQDIDAKMGEGDLGIRFAMDGNARPMRVAFQLHGEDLDSTDLLLLRKKSFVDSGTFDADIRFEVAGDTSAQMAAGADGHIVLRLNQARMKNQSLDILGGDIFSNLMLAINPFREIDEHIEIECSVVQFKFVDGRANNRSGLAIKADRVSLLGGGEIDLRDESMRIQITPKARKGFGINPSSIAKVVRLGGTLTRPKIEADNTRVLETGATVWAAIASGGLSLIVKGLFDRGQANADICGLRAEAAG